MDPELVSDSEELGTELEKPARLDVGVCVLVPVAEKEY